MKKIIGILSTGALILTLFMNVNSTNVSSTDLGLASLMALNSANAECEYEKNGECEFKCDDTPNETCENEVTVDGHKTRVTCDGKEVDC